MSEFRALLRRVSSPSAGVVRIHTARSNEWTRLFPARGGGPPYLFKAAAVETRSCRSSFGRVFGHIPLGFAILGAVLVSGLIRSGEQRHGMFAGILILGGMMIWLTYNWPTIHRFLGG